MLVISVDDKAKLSIGYSTFDYFSILKFDYGSSEDERGKKDPDNPSSADRAVMNVLFSRQILFYKVIRSVVQMSTRLMSSENETIVCSSPENFDIE